MKFNFYYYAEKELALNQENIVLNNVNFFSVIESMPFHLITLVYHGNAHVLRGYYGRIEEYYSCKIN